jgi:hypothetical protein
LRAPPLNRRLFAFVEHVVPNFYFHLAHVYAILRHNGVNVGKKDYLGTLNLRAP